MEALPHVIQFSIQKAEEGGFFATAVHYSIFTQGETLDELMKNIREAVECHFDTAKTFLPILANIEVPQYV